MNEAPKEHNELMHYTSASGLHGIISSKTLWASHTSFMNDEEEITGFYRRVLPMIMRQEYEQLAVDFEYFRETVNDAASQLGIDLIDCRVKTWIENLDPLIKAQNYFVTSFCTATNDWISHNGLLSQWRGYGEDGGYAIVFDTEKLHSLLEAEGKLLYCDEELNMMDVEYNLAQFPNVTVEEVKDYLGQLKLSIHAMLRGESIDYDTAADNVCRLSMLCKHRGFEEEREVRIVVREPSLTTQQALPNESGKPYRKVWSYLRNGVSVPCVHLFEKQTLEALPIRRVIVGPHSDKVDRTRAVELLLHEHNIHAEVRTSETPYRGK